ncbi:MAG: GNAT family N-acetyltransferase, partial [Spirochaetales bacterium]|nr:GNAT family N-acetyltransferase [Spirochaetales bacterium]
KEVDWLEFEIKTPADIPEKVKRVQEIVLKRSNMRLLKAKRPKDILPYAMKIFDTLNEGYKDLFGFVELDEEQKAIYTKQYFPFIDPDFTKIVIDENDDVAGFGIAMPSLSRALQKSGGRLFPFGFIHLLMALKFPKQIDMYLVAVKPKYQNLGINAILMSEITSSCIRRGIKSAETSGELEDNKAVQDFWKNYDKRQHKRRRCFGKSLR